MNKHKNVDMLNGNLYINILLFAIPLMTSSILQLLFNAADIIVVGRYAGDQSMAAVSSCGALVSLIVNLFVGLSVGANVSIAHSIGARDENRAHMGVQTAIALALSSGVFLLIFGFFLAPVMINIMGTPDDVLPLAIIYLKMYFLGMPGLMLYNYGSAVLRARGDTKRPLYYLTIAGVVNFAMNLIFVIVFKMDAAGVGLATAISQYVSGLLILNCLIKDNTYLNCDIRHLSFNRDCLGEMAKIGLPAGFQGMMFSISNVVIQSSVNSFGSIVMAGNGAAANIEGFVYTSMNSFHQSCLTFTSQNMGAGQKKRVRDIMVDSIIIVTVVGLVMGLGVYYNGEVLLSIYTNDSAVIAAGMERFALVARPYFLCGVMDVIVGSLRGIGMSFMPMVVSLLGVCGLRLVWIATIFAAHHTQAMLYWSYPISWIVTAFFHFCFFIWGFRKIMKE